MPKKTPNVFDLLNEAERFDKIEEIFCSLKKFSQFLLDTWIQSIRLLCTSVEIPSIAHLWTTLVFGYEIYNPIKIIAGLFSLWSFRINRLKLMACDSRIEILPAIALFELNQRELKNLFRNWNFLFLIRQIDLFYLKTSDNWKLFDVHLALGLQIITYQCLYYSHK